VTAEPLRQNAMVVLDASALLRLYLADGPLPQGLEPVMERGCRGDLILMVPDLCWLEISSVLCRQINRELLSSDEVSELFVDIERLPLRTMASRDLCVAAMQLSQVHGISVYDATYLALALRHGASLFTADARLLAAARASGAVP
jgi:predicted nucleic acid-binding protein